MKSSEKKTFIILLIMFIVLLFNNFIEKIYDNTTLNNILFFLISFILSAILLKISKDRHLHIADIVQIIIIYILTYLIFTYLLGLIFGYYRNIYSLEFITIVKNVIPVFILILLQELVRFAMVSKANKKVIFILIVLVFTFFNVTINLKSYNLSDGMEVFELIAGLIIPSLITNSLLTFVTYKCGFMPSLVYKSFFELYIFVVPVFPDFGPYIKAILEITFPTLLFLKLNTILGKKTFKVNRKGSVFKLILAIPSACLTIVMIALISGVFKYYSIAIGSNSMYKAIAKGDVVIVEKLEEKELDKLEIGDVLVYHHDNKRIVHRIIKKRFHNNMLVFNTKGDNNEQKDMWDIKAPDVLGVVKYKIPYIGYPSVWLSEALK